ncbi:MAG: hypothetical protein Q8O67_09235 [Deltaproteobacteria bacterium]|nr:hypothetical protein [Deltaproteobacteria bacterium]
MFVVIVVQLLVSAPPGWCAEATRRLESARAGVVTAPASIESLLAALPTPVAARAREDIGREARLEAAVDSAATAIHTACAPVVDVGGHGDPGVEVRDLLRDSRFGGLRTDDDFSDKLLERLWKYLEAFLGSEGMQLFADNTRVVYLALLALAGGVVAVQLLRRSRRAADGPGRGTGARIERQRLKAFAAWRAEALPLLDDDVQARRALLLLRAALLARVGEQDKNAVTPSRTSLEILERLGARAVVVAPALHRFDAAFYAGTADKLDARALLVDVDAAAAALLAEDRA